MDSSKGDFTVSWIQKLYETYENCHSMVGVESPDGDVPLLPICHTTQKAHIEIAIDGEGNFLRASTVPKQDARTIIPCSEASGGRTSGEAPHPLCDKLQYIAGDYSLYGGEKESYFASYCTNLESWCNSQHQHPKAIAVLSYTKKKSIMADLLKNKVLISDENGKLLPKWDKTRDGTSPAIFELVTNQSEAFVRWIVEIPGEPQIKVWRDESLWDAWIAFYSKTKQERALCYVTGSEELIADQHPAKLLNDGDKAKLISANDMSGFTFRGRFTRAQQAVSVGFETTQKAHFALRWLISRQGYRKGSMAIVAWATSGVTVPNPLDDTLTALGFEDLPTYDSQDVDTAQEIGIAFKKRLAGYGKQLSSTTNIVVMAIDSATPGRASITYYRELSGSDYLSRVDEWHSSCSWLHRYSKIEYVDEKTGKTIKKYIPFIGAPAPNDIAEAAYSTKIDEKLRKTTISRLLPCIIDAQPIPHDLVNSAFRRACNKVNMEKWEWEKSLSITCALYRKSHPKEDYDMALDPNRKTRDYLYGRLLALAESLEEWALNNANEKRETNAARLMQRFSEHPFSTWRTIELSLTPYKARLGGKSKKRQSLIDEVIASFKDDDFLNDKRLSGEFLLGYHAQRESLHTGKDHLEESGSSDN